MHSTKRRWPVLICPFGRVRAARCRELGVSGPPRLRGEPAFSGLSSPTVVRFATDGRVVVAEQSGRIKIFDNLFDSTPSLAADLSTSVHSFWDRGLLGLALDPQFPARPFIYASYAHDAAIGGTAPRWGDGCPNPPGATADGCVVSGRLSKLTLSGNVVTNEQVLVEDWCQQYPSHSVGALAFGPDGALYMSAGDGASFNFADYGQEGNPLNPCGDPPGGVGGNQTIPTAGVARCAARTCGRAVIRCRLTAASYGSTPILARACRVIRSREAATLTPAGSWPTASAILSASRSARAQGSCGSATSAGVPGRRSTGSPIRCPRR
jgi:hypothetical protein